MLHRLYIGSNNETHELEIDVIERLAGHYFDGFTIIKSIGYWQGSKEDSCILEIATGDNKKVNELANELKTNLNQQAIGYQIAPELNFI